MHLLKHSTLISSLTVIAAAAFGNAAPANSTASSSSTSTPLTTIQSQNEFCLFLPPQPGLEVAVNENNGIPFCTKQDLVPNAKAFPEGFITTAHYLRSSSYVQITGYLDREKYQLGANDGGGQYDNHAKGKPVGAQCKDYKYFVSMIEPDIDRFCIRCCQEESDCNTGRSGYGCLRIIEGDYSQDNNFSSANNATSNNGTENTAAAASHLNTNMDSVLADLDQLPDTSATASSIPTEEATGDDTPANDDIDDNSSDNGTSSASAASTSANEAIASEIQKLQESNQSGSLTVDQAQTEWNTFSTNLASQHPEVSTQINELNTIASGLTTLDQWKAFLDLVSTKINQLQQQQQQQNAQNSQDQASGENNDADDESANTATPAANADSNAAASTGTTPTESSEPSASLTGTSTNEDLDWLLNQRDSHENQATW